jgi:hypothetical protein
MIDDTMNPLSEVKRQLTLPKVQCYPWIQTGAMKGAGKYGKISPLALEFLVFVAM